VNANINVNVKVDRALDDFFGDLDKKSSTIQHTGRQISLKAMKTSLFVTSRWQRFLFAGALT